MFVGD